MREAPAERSVGGFFIWGQGTEVQRHEGTREGLRGKAVGKETL